MGDIADYMIEGYYEQGGPHWGDYDTETDDVPSGPKRVRCKHCGEGSFVWNKGPEGWRLHKFDDSSGRATGNPHVCDKYRKDACTKGNRAGSNDRALEAVIMEYHHGDWGDR